MKRFLSLFALPVLLFPLFPAVLAQEEDVVEEVASEETAVDTAYQIPNTNNMVTYYIIGIAAFCILFYVATHLAKKKQTWAEQMQIAGIAEKSPAEKKELLESVFWEGGLLEQFQDVAKGEEIQGLRESLPYQTAGGVAKDMAKTLGKQALWSMVGVKATYHDVGKYYLLLTDKNLHYIAFDKHDDVAVHEKFSLKGLKNLTLRKISSKDAMINMDGGGSHVIEFETDNADKKLTFVYKHQNQQYPNVTMQEFQAAYTDNYEAFFLMEYAFQEKLSELAGVDVEFHG